MECDGHQEPGEDAGGSEDARELLWVVWKEKGGGGGEIRALTEPSQGWWFSPSARTFSSVKCCLYF